MKLSDRVWMWSNRKPQRPAQSYLQITLLWTVYGGLFGLGMFMAVLAPKYWYIGAAVVLFCLIMLFWFYWDDRRRGYVDVIHQRWLQMWNERRERITGDSSKVN